jgi:transcriptional regulator with XRE-family HTH domain
MIYGERIKAIRELRGLKQFYVAVKLGIKQQAYSSYELNASDKKLNHLVDVAKILEVDVCLIVCIEIPINKFTIDLKFKDLVSQYLNKLNI